MTVTEARMTNDQANGPDPSEALEDWEDGALLECFLTRREQGAFAILVRRHGPMILGACRRILTNSSDVDDAFQTVFLVLLRKAHELRGRATLGNWLYGVAFHTALKARALAMKRRARESAALPATHPRHLPISPRRSIPSWQGCQRSTASQSSFAISKTCPGRPLPRSLGFLKERCRVD